jgi:hypothetical protein
MANNNNIDNTISTTNTQIISNGYALPADFNNSRQPGKLASLYNLNSNAIYNKYSPKTNNTGLIKFGPKQPFITFTPNTGTKGINALKGTVPTIGAPLQDVERVTKWLFSGNGIIFTAKQFVLQGQNAFNETKIYNPAMPILASVSRATFGAFPMPTRFLDLSNGFVSILGFGSSPTPIATTVAMTNPNVISNTAKLVPNAYKGILRGKSASSGFTSLAQKWSVGSNNTGGGLLNAVGNYIKSGINDIVKTYMPIGQPGVFQYRADEHTYGRMLGSKTKFETINKDGSMKSGVHQRFFNGIEITNGNVPSSFVRYSPFTTDKGITIQNGPTGTINGNPFGIKEYNPDSDDGASYEVYIGMEKWKKNNDINSLEFSDQVVNYSYYIGKTKINKKNNYFEDRSKFSDPSDYRVKAIQDNLQKVIDGLKKQDSNANNQKYSLNDTNGYAYSPLPQFSNALGGTFGYNYIDKVTDKKEGADKTLKYLTPERFKSIKTIDPIQGKNPSVNKDYGFSGTSRSDKINTLGVLKSDDFGVGKNKFNQYDPNQDDLISFYFHDIVNDRYIPFRSSIRGINETSTAEWNDVNYMGRADKLFTYKGFTRAISFNFIVNISSIKEFASTWQRINYFMGLVKPANYTSRNNSNLNEYSRFIIPPLIKFTLGDMYVDQPAIITSISFSIPEDASWETLNENFAKENDWKYLTNVIQLNESKNKYAQMPRTVDFSVSMNLLEKEKPIVGGSQFGSSYRKGENYSDITNEGTFSSKLLI